MTTIPSGVHQNADRLTEEEKTDLVQATAAEIKKYFSIVPAENKRLRGHDVSRRSAPGDPTNEDTRVLMAFVKALYSALFNGEWADPNTLELAPNGKIRVKDVFVKGNRAPDVNGGNDFYLIEMLPETVKAKIAALLKENGGLSFDEDGKLKVDFQALTVDQLTALCDPDGGIVVNDDEEADGYGKLKIDFSSMDPAIMQAVVYAMTQQGGGLSVDQNGQLYVDFDSMPTDKFEALLKSLKMLVPLTSNMTLYVDTSHASAGDTIIDDRGTESLPFKTIGGAVRFVVNNYSLGSYSVSIRVKAGTYNENLTLPEYATGGGTISIFAHSGSRNVTLNNVSGGTTVTCSGGRWTIRDIDLVMAAANPTSPTIRRVVQATNGAILTLYGNSYSNVFPANFDRGGYYYEVRMIEASGGTIIWGASTVAHAISAQTSTNVSTRVLMATLGGNITLMALSQEDLTMQLDCACTGACTTFAFSTSSSSFVFSGSPQYGPTFTGASMTGKRYQIESGSNINTNGGGADYFPGDVAGTAEDGQGGRAQTYCWYK